MKTEETDEMSVEEGGGWIFVVLRPRFLVSVFPLDKFDAELGFWIFLKLKGSHGPEDRKTCFFNISLRKISLDGG